MPGPDDKMASQSAIPGFDVIEAGPDILKVRMR
jgi:hypothetical protein